MFLITPDEEPIFTAVWLLNRVIRGWIMATFIFGTCIDVKTSSPVSGLIKIIEVHACTNMFCS